jgi:hypothetical protein
MGFLRFRRSFRIGPGLRINIGKRGASLSAGVRGAHVTVGKDGVRTTVGIPGTGISYTEQSGRSSPDTAKAPAEPPGGGSALRASLWIALLVILVVGAVIFASG